MLDRMLDRCRSPGWRDCWTDKVEALYQLVIRRSAATGEEFNIDPLALHDAGQCPTEDYDLLLCTTAESWADKFNAAGFVQDPDVLDTWFSSPFGPTARLAGRTKRRTCKNGIRPAFC